MNITSPSSRKAIRTGLIFGVVLIFLILIGFPTAGGALLGRLLGNAPKSDALPTIGQLVLFWALLGLWNGSLAAKLALNQGEKNAWLKGLYAGIVTGLMTGVFVWLISVANVNKIALRNYLNELSSPVIQYDAFKLSPIQAAGIYLVIFLLSGALGALMSQIWRQSSAGPWISRQWQALKENKWFATLRTNKIAIAVTYIILVLLCFFLPRQWGSYWNYVIGLVGIYVILGLGLNLIVGFSGQLVLGYVSFFAIGAYTVALLNAPEPHHIMLGFWPALALGILAAAFVGILIGLPIIRLRGDYLAIVTLGFGEIIRILLKSDMLSDFTGGPRGVQDIHGPTLFGITFNSDIDFMYLIILAVLLSYFIASRLQHSRVGRAWVAIREDETVARASGVNTVYYKLLALALGAALAGLGGGLFAARNQFTGPEDHVMMVSINILCIIIIGGNGSLPGAFLGALVLKGLPEVLREMQSYRLLIFGALLVLMMIVKPQGLWPVGRNMLEKKSAAKEKPDQGGPHDSVS
jgi:ABC-type branched-subunit amino acid transport system permease subunit